MSKELDIAEGRSRLVQDSSGIEVKQIEQATVDGIDVLADCASFIIDLSAQDEDDSDYIEHETSVPNSPPIKSKRQNGRSQSMARRRARSDAPNNDPMKLYLHEISRFDLLTKDDEIRLGKKVEAAREAQAKLDEATGTHPMTIAQKRACTRAIREGERAREEFVTANLRLVVSIAKRYSRVLKGAELLDIVQEGNIGVAHAVDKFDWKKGFKFSTYATWWIRQSISRAIANQNRLVRAPVHIVEAINELRGARKYLETELQRQPSNEEVASLLGWTQEQIDNVAVISRQGNTESLDAPIYEESDFLYGDLAFDDSILSVFESLESEVATEKFKEVLQQILDPREYRIIVLRYGLDGEEPRTLQAVGDEFGLTRERIRQINNHAMVKLRHPGYSDLMAKFKFWL